jgi:hypothetical protein
MIRNILLFGTAMTLLAASAAAGNIVLNPGFETSDFTSWTVNGWDVDTIGGDVTPHSGTYFADTGCVGAGCFNDVSGAFFFQDLATTMGATYTISFWYDLGNTLCGACDGTGETPDDPDDDFA